MSIWTLIPSLQTVAHIESSHDLWVHPACMRFKTYASYVHEITIFFSTRPPKPSIWMELDALLTKDDPILSRLRRVTLKHQCAYDELSMGQGGRLVLLSPSVCWAEIEGVFDDEGWNTTVANHLLARFPNLEGALIANTQWISLLSMHRRLKTLRAFGNEPNVQHIACMADWPALQSLTFNTHPMFRSRLVHPLSPYPEPTPLLSLPFLKNLQVDAFGYTFPIFLSARLPSRSLSYTFDPRGGYNRDFRVPFDTIADAYSQLTELTLTVHSTWRPGSRRNYLSRVLAPLAPPQRLRVFNITFQGEHLSYNADDLRKLPLMWPALVELRIAVDPYAKGTDDDMVSLGVLPELARALPELRVLHLPQTLFRVGSLDVAAAAYEPHRAPYELRLGPVQVRGGHGEDARREVRGFLSALFPNAGHRVTVKTEFYVMKWMFSEVLWARRRAPRERGIVLEENVQTESEIQILLAGRRPADVLTSYTIARSIPDLIAPARQCAGFRTNSSSPNLRPASISLSLTSITKMAHDAAPQLVDDVLPEIFAYLDSRDDVSRRTLFALAISSRRFSRPALDVLWQALPSDRPLVVLLHLLGISQSSTWQWDEAASSGSWDRPPSEEDAQVRREWERTDPGWFYTVAHFKSANELRRHPNWAHFYTYSRTDQWNNLVADSLVDFCPNLQHLTIDDRPWLYLLAHFPRLKTVHCTYDVTPYIEDLESMAACPALESFSFHLYRETIYYHSEPPPRRPFCLPFLHTLAIHSDPYGSAIEMFAFVRLPALHTLSYTFDPRLFENGIDVPLGAIAAAYPHLATLKLTIIPWAELARQITPFYSPTPPRVNTCMALSVRLGAVLAHLAPIRDLRGLHLTVQGERFGYGDDDLRAVATAWPRLVELRISVDGAIVEGEGEEVATLDGLAELARGLPELRVLHVPRVALSRGSRDVVSVEPHRALRDLKLGPIGVREGRGGGKGEQEVRACLRMLFPRVEVRTAR
ncbi:uncharacterized protein BXZ73DRAFT_79542 [Epithele typhae]|uniref:uncharacterized protein n=1 Tax=Epithele typhae TaxID=378194 RepID=UPI002007FCC5|nr:uncharacterized protein BXZ73DRAFT_79542 [Epithele typhae]KAH9923123.1 hypothetical protein BXZ73DRAFT_79542 [Epithele typhae]